MAHIYIDGEALFRTTDGVGRYAQKLISELAQIDHENSYTVLGFKGDEKLPHLIEDGHAGVDFEYLPIPRKLYNLLFKWGVRVDVRRLLKQPTDLVIYPNFVSKPRISGVRSILVIHDLAFLETPDMIEQKNLRYLQNNVADSINRTSLIAAVSEATKQDLVQLMAIPANRVRVVRNAVGENFFMKPDDNELLRLRAKFDLPEKFILHVGTVEPRKNHLGLLEAYEHLPGSIRKEFGLVLAGGFGWKYKEIQEVVGDLQAGGDNVLMIGKVNDQDLATLYHAASVFALPSHFEGFGLPLAEAMAAGIPSLTSNRGPMIEIAGDAALLVDPDDYKSIADGLTRLVSDEKLRAQLSERAPQHIAGFNWNQSAHEMLSAIRELLA